MEDNLLNESEIEINNSIFSRDSLLKETNYNNDFEILEDMGYDSIMIKKVYAFLKPNSLEQAIDFMTQENEIYHHNFFKNYKHKRKTCYICNYPKENHINYNELENDEEDLNIDIDSNDLYIEDNGNNFNCAICGENYKKDSKNIIKYNKCGDEYCFHCWFSYLRGKIEEGFVNNIKCMNYTCKEILSDNFIKEIINNDKNLMIKYEKFLSKAEILNSKTKKFCPINGCESYGEKTTNNKYIKCKNGHQFCFVCLKEWHGNNPCITNEDDYFQIWKKGKIIKQCPNCKIWTEKNEGCNHMTCAECKYQWCWLCNNKYSYNHYTQGQCKGLQFYKARTEKDIENILKDNPNNLNEEQRRRRAWRNPQGKIFFKYYDFYGDLDINDPLISFKEENIFMQFFFCLLYFFLTFQITGYRFFEYAERRMDRLSFNTLDFLYFLHFLISFLFFFIYLIIQFVLMLLPLLCSLLYFPLFEKIWILWYLNIIENIGFLNFNRF